MALSYAEQRGRTIRTSLQSYNSHLHKNLIPGDKHFLVVRVSHTVVWFKAAELRVDTYTADRYAVNLVEPACLLRARGTSCATISHRAMPQATSLYAYFRSAGVRSITRM
jgi:hypothetical protein